MSLIVDNEKLLFNYAKQITKNIYYPGFYFCKKMNFKYLTILIIFLLSVSFKYYFCKKRLKSKRNKKKENLMTFILCGKF